MQKIKYIIIFTLLLALGMIYIQLADYQKITSTLLDNNSKNKTETEQLINKIKFLNEENEELRNKTISLEEKLSLTQIQLNNKILLENNNSLINPIMDMRPYTIEEDNNLSPLNLVPKISLDKENEFSGFELEYNQKF